MLAPVKKQSTLSVLMLSAFIDYSGVAIVFTVFTYLLFDPTLHFFPTTTSAFIRGVWLGALTALHPMMQFLSAPVFGALSDMKGRRGPMINSLIFSLVGYCFAILGVCMQNLGFLALYRIFVGIGAGNCSLINAIVADISSKEEKARHFGYMSMSMGVGFTVAPFMSGVLARWAGYTAPFALPLLLVALNLLLVLWKLPETNPVYKHGMVHPLRALTIVKKAWDMKPLRVVFLTLLFFSLGWSFFYEFAALYLKETFAFTTQETGFFYGFSALFYSLSAGFLLYPFTRLIGTKRILMFSMILSGILLLITFSIQSPWTLWLYIPFLQAALAFVYPTTSTVISDTVDQENQGEALGIYHSIVALAMAVSPCCVGGIMGKIPALSVILGGFMMLLAGIINGLFYYRYAPLSEESAPDLTASSTVERS